MAEFFTHFLIGFTVSFLGSLSLGTVNLAVIQTTINVNFRAGFYLALGATLIELVYSAIAIRFIAASLISNPMVDLIIQIVAIPVFLILGIVYLRKQDSMDEEPKIVKRKTSFYNGLFIGLINPMQIPFWIAYGSYLLSNHYIMNDSFLLNIFIIGICSGTIAVLTLLAYFSKKIIGKLALQTKWVNKIIGVVLIILTGYQIFKVSLHFLK